MDIQDNADIFSSRIKSRRKVLKMTQTELAEKLGVTQTTIAQYESGTLVPSVNRLLQLDKALHGGVLSEGQYDGTGKSLLDVLLSLVGGTIADYSIIYGAEHYSVRYNGENTDLDPKDYAELERITDNTISYFEFEFDKFIKKLKERNGQ